jgi:hypothetical protein
MKLRQCAVAAMVATALTAFAAIAPSAFAGTTSRTAPTSASAPSTRTDTISVAVASGIQERACSNSTATWVHVYSTVHGQMCYGFVGETDPGVYAGSIYSGNNCGWFQYTSHGSNFYVTMVPGDTYNLNNDNHSYVFDLDIWGWVGGGQGCNP